jgi:citrate synthase
MAKTITHDEAGNAKFGDEDHLQIAQTRSFTSMIFELLSEKVPTEAELKVFELILNLSIDHGPDTPSAMKVIREAKEGEDISESVSEGIEEINDMHGGAQEKLMEILYEIRDKKYEIRDKVEEALKDGKRIPGYGHRIYKTEDPRAQLILKTLNEELKIQSEEWIKIAQELETELETQKGNKLPLNIDGAIAVVLCTFGWPARLGKAVFIVARTPGLCGQYLNATA